jgi:peptide/nickel transport system ATP-binding protein
VAAALEPDPDPDPAPDPDPDLEPPGAADDWQDAAEPHDTWTDLGGGHRVRRWTPRVRSVNP